MPPTTGSIKQSNTHTHTHTWCHHTVARKFDSCRMYRDFEDTVDLDETQQHTFAREDPRHQSASRSCCVCQLCISPYLQADECSLTIQAISSVVLFHVCLVLAANAVFLSVL